jgi:hypothetical protein
MFTHLIDLKFIELKTNLEKQQFFLDILSKSALTLVAKQKARKEKEKG